MDRVQSVWGKRGGGVGEEGPITLDSPPRIRESARCTQRSRVFDTFDVVPCDQPTGTHAHTPTCGPVYELFYCYVVTVINLRT